MIHASAVDIEEMRSRLLTLDEVAGRLSATEPLSEQVFEARSAQLRLGDTWTRAGDGEPADAWLRVSGLPDEFRLTRGAALEVGAFCKIPRKLQQEWPPDLLQVVVNRALAESITRTREMKLLTMQRDGAVIGTGLTRGTVSPFSNLALMDTVLDGIRARYGAGTEVLADYKFHHTPERTDVRFIVPGHQRVITGTRVPDDTWSTGVAFTNSLTGTEQTRMSGNLFRWWCTNGSYDTAAEVSALNRRQVSDPSEAYEWAREQVDAILGGLETSLDSVQELTGIPVAGEVGVILRGLFNEFGVPSAQRQRIIAEMAELDGDLTMYDLQQAVTVAANADGLSPDAVDSLLTLGGHIAHVRRCDESSPCRRPLPPDWN